MLNRYGLGIGGVILGALIVWAFFGFKNPFGNGNGDGNGSMACTMPDGVTKGTLQADGSCKA